MDFITELPVSEGCDQLWVVIDRFTKMAHFVPLREKGAADLAKIFAREIWRFHGLPTDIVSDRDSRFTSEVWQELLKKLGIRPWMSRRPNHMPPDHAGSHAEPHVAVPDHGGGGT